MDPTRALNRFSSLEALDNQSLAARFREALASEPGIGKNTRRKGLTLEQQALQADITQFSSALLRAGRGEVLTELLKGPLADLAKVGICRGIATSGSLDLEPILLGSLLTGTRGTAEACREALVDLGSPWLMCFARHAEELKDDRVDAAAWGDAASRLSSARPEWAEPTGILAIVTSPAASPQERSTRAAALASLRPDEAGRSASTSPRVTNSGNIARAWLDATEHSQRLSHGGAGVLVRRWLRGLALVWPDDSVPQDLRHQARKDALGARDQRDVDLLRPYLLQASGETRVWFVTRKLHKPDRKDPLGVALALEVLSVLEVETELTLPDALLPILEWDDQAVSLRTAELLVRRSTPCSAAVRLLAQRLDASVGTQDPATVLRALAARHDSQPTVDLEEVSEQSRREYLVLLFTSGRLDVARRDLGEWVRSAFERDPDRLVSVINAISELEAHDPDRVSLAQGIAERLHGFAAVVEMPEAREALAAAALSPFLAEPLQTIGAENYCALPAWWRESLLRSWLQVSPEDTAARLSLLRSKGLFDPADSADLLADLWSKDVRGLDTALADPEADVPFRSAVLERAVAMLQTADRDTTLLLEEKGERGPLWLAAFAERVVPQLRSCAAELQGNDGLTRLVETLADDIDELGRRRLAQQEADSAAQVSATRWLQARIGSVGLPWASLGTLPVVETWLDDKAPPQERLAALAALLGDVGKRAHVPGLASTAERQVLQRWLGHAWAAVAESAHAWRLWTGHRQPLTSAHGAYLTTCWRTCSKGQPPERLTAHLVQLQASRFAPVRGDPDWATNTMVSEFATGTLPLRVLGDLDRSVQSRLVARIGQLLRDTYSRLASAREELRELESQGLHAVANRIKARLTVIDLAVGPLLRLRGALEAEGLHRVLEGLGRKLREEELRGVGYRLADATESVTAPEGKGLFEIISTGLRVRGETTPTEVPILKRL